eukprot:Skav202155  [mRNA]  locus=scaffold970:209398:209748:+ [translate_table: standard]
MEFSEGFIKPWRILFGRRSLPGVVLVFSFQYPKSIPISGQLMLFHDTFEFRKVAYAKVCRFRRPSSILGLPYKFLCGMAGLEHGLQPRQSPDRRSFWVLRLTGVFKDTWGHGAECC